MLPAMQRIGRMNRYGAGMLSTMGGHPWDALYAIGLSLEAQVEILGRVYYCELGMGLLRYNVSNMHDYLVIY